MLGLRMKNFIFGILLLFDWLVATAQQATFIDLGVVNGQRVAVGAGANAQRVGNAVLTYVHRHSAETFLGVSSPVLFGCDSSWIDTLEATFHHFNQEWSPKTYEVKARAETFSSVQSAIELNDWQSSELFFAKRLRAHTNTICKSAGPEPKNYQIPVAVSSEDGTKPGFVRAILTGSISRKGSVFDLWGRDTYFKLKPFMIGDKPMVENGVERQFREPTGAYAMHRTAFDCINRKMGGYHYIEYNQAGTVVSQSVNDREKLQLVDVVPSSIGEGTLEAACRIYWRK